jgi:hypothetical protein
VEYLSRCRELADLRRFDERKYAINLYARHVDASGSCRARTIPGGLSVSPATCRNALFMHFIQLAGVVVFAAEVFQMKSIASIDLSAGNGAGGSIGTRNDRLFTGH